MSVREAADTLNVNRQRIHQLLKVGVLTGEKSGGVWIVDRASVAARLAAPKNRGGPRRTPPADATLGGEE
jgi:excisionase family DNA binding protein